MRMLGYLRVVVTPLSLIVVLSLAGGTAFGHFGSSSKGAPFAWREGQEIQAPEFQILDQEGRPLALSDLRGRIVLVNFAFSSCSESCPFITAKLASLQREIPEGSFHFVTVTTDPEVDHPPVLKEYGKKFGVDFSGWSFLSGPKETLEAVWEDYGVNVTPIERGLVDHNYVLVLIDEKGIWRVTYHGETWDTADVLRDLQRLLSSSSLAEK
jgi:protein SCO1/2